MRSSAPPSSSSQSRTRPATKTQVEVGLNVTGLTASDRLVALPAGGMCNYRVRVASLAEVDAALLGWIRKAYDAAA